jgi:hypothetical protein
MFYSGDIWRYLLASLALLLLSSVPGGLAWAQDGDGRTCPPGTHCRHPPPVGKPCIGPCDPDAPPPPRFIVVDWRNSGFQDGTAAHPFRTLPDALAAATPGETIVIRTGTYNLDGGLLNKAATFRAENGPVTIINHLVAVTTYHYDNNRTGWNSNESILTPANVTPNGFGLIAVADLDDDNDQVDAQPLIVPNQTIQGIGARRRVRGHREQLRLRNRRLLRRETD